MYIDDPRGVYSGHYIGITVVRSLPILRTAIAFSIELKVKV
jgi:hypothetical protein